MAAARFLPQELLERFDVEGAIGRSDRWETYIAEDREEGGTCVIRVDRELPASPRDRRYLEESYLKLRRIRHPALPRVIHLGMPRSGGMYLVHEFVHGVNLRNAAPHIGLAGIVDVLAKALPALHLLHLHEIVHQRLTPEKIIVEGLGPDRKVRIVDTGLSPSPDGRRWSPPAYAAPELAGTGRYDGRSDLYSLAVLLYEVIVGRHPFPVAGAGRGMLALEYRDLPPICPHRPDCPPALEEILMRMGAHEPRERPRNAFMLGREMPRTGLLKSDPPKLDVETVIQSFRYKLYERRVKQILDELGPGPLPTQITCDEGLEEIADELRARATLRRPPLMIALQSPRPLNTPRSIGTSYRNANSYHVQLLLGHAEINGWIARISQGPAEKRVLKLLIEMQPAQSVEALEATAKRAIILEDGIPALDADPLTLTNLIDSLRPRSTRDVVEPRNGQTDDYWAARCAKAGLPGIASGITKKSEGLKSSNSSKRLSRMIRLGLILADSARWEEAASALNVAAKMAEGFGRKCLPLRLKLKSAIMLSRSLHAEAEDGLKPESKTLQRLVAGLGCPRARLLFNELQARCALLTNENIRLEDLEFECVLKRESHQECPCSRNGISRDHRTTRVSLILRAARKEGGLPELRRATEMLASTERPWNRRHCPIGVPLSAALITLGEYRAALRTAIQGARFHLSRGCAAGAASAMHNVSVALYHLGKYEAGERWDQFSERLLRLQGVLEGRPRALVARAAFHMERGDLGMARECLAKGLRISRTFGRPGMQDQNAVYADLLLGIGHIGSAWLWASCASRSSTLQSDGYVGSCLVRLRILAINGAVDEFQKVARTLLANPSALSPEQMHYLGNSSVMRKGIWDSLEDPHKALLAEVDNISDRPFYPMELERRALDLINRVMWDDSTDSVCELGLVKRLARELVSAGLLIVAVRLLALCAGRSLILGLVDRSLEYLYLRSSLRRMCRLACSLTCERSDNFVLDKFVERAMIRCNELAALKESASTWASSLAEAFAMECSGEGPGGREFGRALDGVLLAGQVTRVYIYFRSAENTFEGLSRSGKGCSWRRCSQQRMTEVDRVCSVRYAEWGSDAGFVYSVVSDESVDGFVLIGQEQSSRGLVLSRSSLKHKAQRILFALKSDWARRKIGSSIKERKIVRIGELSGGGKDALITRSIEMQRVLDTVGRLAERGVPMILLGESGSGKELVARYAHYRSRRKGDFVPVDCPSISVSLAEAELFGHSVGAYTGAKNNRAGLLEMADGGTLFLDEIADLPADMQAKVLRALSCGEVRRLGVAKAINVEFLLVSATNIPLLDLANSGRFRMDLLFRLGVQVVVPPLRERPEDIMCLWEHFLAEAGTAYEYEASIADILRAEQWEGNVRQLRNVAQGALALSTDGRVSISAVLQALNRPTLPTVHLVSTECERIERGIDLLKSRSRVTRREYARFIGVSSRSALRDLIRICELGYAVRRGLGRSTKYVWVGKQGEGLCEAREENAI